MRNKNIFSAISLLIIGAVFGAVLVSGFGFDRPGYAEVRLGTEAPPVQAVDEDIHSFQGAFIDVAEKVSPSIVQISVVSEVSGERMPNDPFHWFNPFRRDDEPNLREGGGSGVIISDDGYILTNNHVVENATSVKIGLLDRREFDAEVVGTDPLTDLAVVKIHGEDLPVAYLGNSDNVKVGQWVVAIGNPLGLTSTITAGIVSAMGRNINIIRDSYGVESFIQTDAAINPGNSGGALVDLEGAVIGINTAIATNGFSSNYIGYGFAIPVNLAKAVAEDLIANGKVSRGYIGVQISEVDAALADAVGLDKPMGVVIQKIVADGSAATEDVQEGDIILKIDGHEVNKPNELQSYVASKRAGQSVTLSLFRDGDKLSRTIVLKARDEDVDFEPVVNRKENDNDSEKGAVEVSIDNIGLTVKNLTRSELDSYNLEHGILITDVKKFSKAYDQNLRQGMIITSIDKMDVDRVSDFEDTVNKKSGGAVLLKVANKEGATRIVGLQIPEK